MYLQAGVSVGGERFGKKAEGSGEMKTKDGSRRVKITKKDVHPT
jgi:hypothetical protein